MSNPLTPTWTQENVVALRDFIGHNRTFLAYLKSRKPPVTGTENVEAMAMNARLRDGFDEAIKELEAMAGDIMPNTDAAGFVDTHRDS